MRNRTVILASLICLGSSAGRASVALLLEEPFGAFGGLTPTGHAAVYLSHVCAASPLSLRRCQDGEEGVVLSRYHRIGGYDWIAIPLLPYLYAVDRPEQVPSAVTAADVATLRNAYRRKNLTEVAPDAKDGSPPSGAWIQLAGAAYDRTIYAFEIATTPGQDDEFIARFNSRPNDQHFNLLFHNCADFARQAVDFFYPHAVHRSLLADMGIMSPKQAAKSLVSYSRRHPNLQLASFVIPQVHGTVPRSTPVRGVLESFVKSKKYAVPLVSVAALHPFFGGFLALDWVEGSHFDPRRIAGAKNSSPEPAMIEVELESKTPPAAAAANGQ